LLQHLPKSQRIKGKFSAPSYVSIDVYNHIDEGKNSLVDETENLSVFSNVIWTVLNGSTEKKLTNLKWMNIEENYKMDWSVSYEGILEVPIDSKADALRLRFLKNEDDTDLTCIYRIRAIGNQ